MKDEITLRLDRATAEDLYATLYEVGEHRAAGEVERYRPRSNGRPGPIY